MKKFKLDKKDWKILHQLDSNARQSCSQIARKVGLSSEVVNYRIKRLEHEQIITHYQVIVNLSRLNIIQFKVCLSFQHMTSVKLRKIVQVLKANEEIKWIVECKGKWDMIISCETDTLSNLDLLKEWIIRHFEGYVNNKALSILVKAYTFNREYFLSGPHKDNRARIIMKKDAIVEIDDLDIKILKKLVENGRAQIIDMAAELNSTARTINYRIQQLRKKQIILGFKIAINYHRLGIKFYKTFIHIDKPKNDRIKSLMSYLANHKNVIHDGKVIGSWDLEPEYEVFSEKEFDMNMIELRDKYADIIKSVDIVTISKEHKFVYF